MSTQTIESISPSSLTKETRSQALERQAREQLRTHPTDVRALTKLADAYSSRGDHSEAIRLSQLTLHLDPQYLPAYLHLGKCFLYAGKSDAAVQVYSQCLALEPENAEARHMLAAASGESVPERASDQYVQIYFDRFATLFDQQLADLQYRSPEVVGAALAHHAPAPAPSKQLRILDAGCGTGLCAQYLEPWAQHLIGVDLSHKMIEEARARSVYQELVICELGAFMDAHPQSFDAIVSADVFVYFGALESAMRSACQALAPGGLLIFTVEALCSPGKQPFHLQTHGRYCHRESYLQAVVAQAGFYLEPIQPEKIRLERGEDVYGYLVVARKK